MYHDGAHGTRMYRKSSLSHSDLELRRLVTTFHPYSEGRAGDAARKSASAVSREARWQALSLTGATVLLTGLSGAGKSTLARALERELILRRQAAYVLDGDLVRQGLSSDLGFSAAARSEQLRRVGCVAQMFAD